MIWLAGVAVLAVFVGGAVARGRPWLVIEGHGPFWSGADRIDGNEWQVGEFWTRAGALAWMHRHQYRPRPGQVAAGGMRVERRSEWDAERS